LSPGVAFLLLLIGLFHVIFPRASWFMSIGWKLRDAEPSDAYLALSRVGGGLVSVITVIVLIVEMVQGTAQANHQMDEWNTFRQEMTVQNITSITEQPTGTPAATQQQIDAFVKDINNVSSPAPSNPNQGGGASAYSTYLISCKDGYQVVLIEVDQQGTFGITKDTAVGIIPDYKFTSASLTDWAASIS
jgi:hypothetical protein